MTRTPPKYIIMHRQIVLWPPSFLKMRVANAGIQYNSSLNPDFSTPVTPIQDYDERKEEKQYSP